MSWVVFWIDPKESGTQISVAVTSILTLIAFYIALTGGLPRIAYLTRMDVFILSSTILVFMGLVEVVVTSRLARADRLSLARRIDRICRVVFPIVFGSATIYALFIY